MIEVVCNYPSRGLPCSVWVTSLHMNVDRAYAKSYLNLRQAVPGHRRPVRQAKRCKLSTEGANHVLSGDPGVCSRLDPPASIRSSCSAICDPSDLIYALNFLICLFFDF